MGGGSFLPFLSPPYSPDCSGNVYSFILCLVVVDSFQGSLLTRNYEIWTNHFPTCNKGKYNGKSELQISSPGSTLKLT